MGCKWAARVSLPMFRTFKYQKPRYEGRFEMVSGCFGGTQIVQDNEVGMTDI